MIHSNFRRDVIVLDAIISTKSSKFKKRKRKAWQMTLIRVQWIRCFMKEKMIHRIRSVLHVKIRKLSTVGLISSCQFGGLTSTQILGILYLDNFFTSREMMTKRNHKNAEKFMLTLRTSCTDLFCWPWRKRTPKKHIKRRRSTDQINISAAAAIQITAPWFESFLISGVPEGHTP